MAVHAFRRIHDPACEELADAKQKREQRKAISAAFRNKLLMTAFTIELSTKARSTACYQALDLILKIILPRKPESFPRCKSKLCDSYCILIGSRKYCFSRRARCSASTRTLRLAVRLSSGAFPGPAGTPVGPRGLPEAQTVLAFRLN